MFTCRFESRQVDEVYKALSDALARLSLKATAAVGVGAVAAVSVGSSVSYAKDKKEDFSCSKKVARE